MTSADNRFVERLYFANRGELGAFLKRRLPPLIEFEDIVQEVFLRLCRVRNPERIDNPRAFLFRTAKNVVAESIRKTRVGESVLVNDADVPEALSALPSAEAILQSKLWVSAYSAALDELKPKCRAVFVLCRVHEKKHSEIAAELNISTKMVEKYMTQALAHLNSRLDCFFREGLDT